MQDGDKLNAMGRNHVIVLVVFQVTIARHCSTLESVFTTSLAA